MRVRCWVITLFIIGVCMGGKKSGRLFLPKKLPSRGLRGFTWPQKPFISSTLRFLPLWSLTHSIINKWNVLYCKFFYKVYFKNGFWSDMIHLPLGKASSLEKGRRGDDAWWAAKGLFLGRGLWSVVLLGPGGAGPSKHRPNSSPTRKCEESGGQDWNVIWSKYV